MQPSEADILVVDDIPENLRIAIGLLKEAGYKARGVLSGEHALQAVSSQPPDLILLDIRMPGMDGYQVCAALREWPNTKDIPVIFLSAYSDADEKQLAFDAGGVDYITKPFEAAELLARVKTHLELARNRAELIHTRNMLEDLSKKQRHATRADSEPTEKVTPNRVADILVVDGDIEHLKRMRELLQAHGFGFRGAATGEMALRAVINAPPDLIITDLQFDGMDGFALCEALQKHPESREIPTLFLTHVADSAFTERAFKAGAVDYLVKSSTPKELLARIHLHLRLRRTLQGLEQSVTARSAELLTSEQRYRSIFDTMDEAYLLFDLDGTILMINPATLRHLKYTHVLDLVGKDIATQLYSDPKDFEHLKEWVLKEGHVSGFVTQFKQYDGTIILVDVNAHVTCDAEGRPAAIEGTIRDITDRKHTEEALANLQKLESLGILAAGIAHDFNNLMGGIFGYINLAALSSGDPSVQEYLNKAITAIDRARALTGQLMTFAKGGEPKLEDAPLFPFVQDVAKFALSGTNAGCTFHIEDNLWSATIDKNQIAQVIENFIINAWQAMPLGGAITVSARNVTIAAGEHAWLKEGRYVRLSIADTGIGIPKELQKRIFDPFFTTKPKGHGLGLATCFSIITRHHGTIELESEPGQGATFNIYIPAALQMASDITERPNQTHQGSGRFMVMDDDAMMLDVTSNMLRTFGYTVDGTARGEEAVAYMASALENNTLPVAMLFDLTVRGSMGGHGAIQRIREMNVTIPAFVTSGYADDPIMQRPTDYGFTSSISKPFRWTELSDFLEKHLGPSNQP